MNFIVCALIGIVLGIIIYCMTDKCFILYSNLILLGISSFNALVIYKRRLRYQWLRNYWEFRYEFINSNPEQPNCIKDLSLP